MRFENKRVLITGGASGIGRATSKLYESEGAKVFAVDVNEEGLKETAENTSIQTAVFDISARESCQNAVKAAVEALGGLDILANIAGIFKAHRVEDVDEATWNKLIDVNLGGTFWMSQAAVPHLVDTGGNIVNVASSAGVKGQAFTVPYCATKGAVVLLTQAMAMEYVKEGIRINAIAPGGVNTPIADNFEMPRDPDMDLIGLYTGFRGQSEAEDIANAIAYLSSDESHRIHGEILRVDAGMTAG